MHIGVDLTCLMPPRSGVDVAASELVRGLARIDSRNRYTLFLNCEDFSEFRACVPSSFRLRGISLRNRLVRAFAQQVVLPVDCSLRSIDVLHSPAFIGPLFRRRNVRHLVTIHDMTFFTLGKAHSAFHRSRPFLAAVKRSALRADLINVPSTATRDAMIELWPDIPSSRVRITPWGLGAEFFRPASPQEVTEHRARLRLPERFILFTGTIEPRKNVDILIESYRRLIAGAASDAHLVLAGKLGWGYGPVTELLKSPDLQGRVHCLGYVPPEDLPWIYRAASLFVYPSAYEGFGLPPLEAMACGVPVISSRGSALETNLLGAAELTDPGDPAALLAAMRKVLSEPPPSRLQRIQIGLDRARQFTWTRTAETMLECYRELKPS